MPRKIRQLKADLRRAGARQVAQEGSHTNRRAATPSGSTPVPGTLVELSGDDGADAKPYQERDLREALRRIDEAKRGTQP